MLAVNPRLIFLTFALVVVLACLGQSAGQSEGEDASRLYSLEGHVLHGRRGNEYVDKGV